MTSFEVDATATAEEEEGRGWWVGEEVLELPESRMATIQNRRTGSPGAHRSSRSSSSSSSSAAEPELSRRGVCATFVRRRPQPLEPPKKIQALAQCLSFFALQPPLLDFWELWQFDRSLASFFFGPKVLLWHTGLEPGEITTPLDSAHAPRQAGVFFLLASTLRASAASSLTGARIFFPLLLEVTHSCLYADPRVQEI